MFPDFIFSVFSGGREGGWVILNSRGKFLFFFFSSRMYVLTCTCINKEHKINFLIVPEGFKRVKFIISFSLSLSLFSLLNYLTPFVKIEKNNFWIEKRSTFFFSCRDVVFLPVGTPLSSGLWFAHDSQKLFTFIFRFFFLHVSEFMVMLRLCIFFTSPPPQTPVPSFVPSLFKQRVPLVSGLYRRDNNNNNKIIIITII